MIVTDMEQIVPLELPIRQGTQSFSHFRNRPIQVTTNQTSLFKSQLSVLIAKIVLLTPLFPLCSIMFYPESQVPELPSAAGGGGATIPENTASNSIWNTAGLGSPTITSPNPPAVVPASSTAQLAAQYREFLRMSEQKESGEFAGRVGRVGFANGSVNRKSGFGRGITRQQSDGFGSEPQTEGFGGGGFKSSDTFGGENFGGDTQRVGFKGLHSERVGTVGFRRPDAGFSNQSLEGFQTKSDAFGFPPAPSDVFPSEFNRKPSTDAFGFQRPVESGFRRPTTLATRPTRDAFGFSSSDSPDPLGFTNNSSPDYFPNLGNIGFQNNVMVESPGFQNNVTLEPQLPTSGTQTPTESDDLIREAQIFNPRKLSEQPIGTPDPTYPASEAAPVVGAPLAPPVDAIPSSLSSPSSVPSPVPTNKDPGYYSESECSSNSSENFIAASFTKALQIKDQDTTAGGVVVSTAAAPDHYDAQNFELAAASVLEEDEDEEEEEDEEKVEDWRCIKKPENQPRGGDGNMWGFPRAPGGMVGDGRWGGNAIAAGSHKKQLICKFCKNNREDESVYTTHTLMSAEGKIVCPILYAYECKVCKATGDYAHTLKYCPMLRTAIGPGKVRTPVLPLQATFPQHLSANARQAMGNTNTRPNNNQGGFDKLADLRSAAQTILSFTDQIMSQPGSSNSSAPPTPSTGFPANLPDYLADMQQKQQAAELQKQLEQQIKQLTQQKPMMQQQHGPISPMTPQQQQQLPAAFQQMFQRQIQQQQFHRQQQQQQNSEDPSTELLKLLGIHKSDDNNIPQQQGGADAVSNLSGFGYNGVDNSGKEQWNKITNVYPHKTECSSSLKLLIDNWNVGTANWLRRVFCFIPVFG
eukprot:sb/3461992/